MCNRIYYLKNVVPMFVVVRKERYAYGLIGQQVKQRVLKPESRSCVGVTKGGGDLVRRPPIAIYSGCWYGRACALSARLGV